MKFTGKAMASFLKDLRDELRADHHGDKVIRTAIYIGLGTVVLLPLSFWYGWLSTAVILVLSLVGDLVLRWAGIHGGGDGDPVTLLCLFAAAILYLASLPFNWYLNGCIFKVMRSRRRIPPATAPRQTRGRGTPAAAARAADAAGSPGGPPGEMSSNS